MGVSKTEGLWLQVCLLFEEGGCGGTDQVWVFWVREEVMIMEPLWISQPGTLCCF